MNIVIFSHFYNIDGLIGAVRWTSLSKRLSQKHNLYVVTHDPKKVGTVEKEGNITVIYQDDECAYVKRGSNKEKANSNSSTKQKTFREVKDHDQNRSIKKRLKDTVKIVLYMWSMKKTSKANVKKLLNYLDSNGVCVDYIISTSRPFIGCFNAYYITRKLRVPWLLDQRDLPFSYTDRNSTDEKFYKREFKKFEKYVTKHTLVSKGMAESFVEFMDNKNSDKVNVLYNGYNIGDIVEVKDSNDKKIKFSYVGDLYEGMRDARILFDALHKLSEKRADFSILDFQFDYAGSDSSSLFENARKYGFESIINDNGKVKHSEAIRIQQESDFVLLLTWNTLDYKGILPGKFYECMLVNKPVICITSGTVSNGEAGQMVRDMNLGIAVEYLDYEKNLQKLTDYLDFQYSRFKEGKPMLFEPDKKSVCDFNYDNLVLKLENILFS